VNWAHIGYPDEPGSLAGFYWGTGSAITSLEILQPAVGDALIDVRAGEVVGIGGCTIAATKVHANGISSHLSSSRDRTFLVRFHSV